MRLDAIAIGNDPPRDINVIIEVPIGGEPIKYEMDKASGTLFVDRFLYTPMRYPGNYGFVPHTLSADGDPIDVLVCNTRAIVPGAVINCRPIGVLVMEDDGGGDEAHRLDRVLGGEVLDVHVHRAAVLLERRLDRERVRRLHAEEHRARVEAHDGSRGPARHDE